MEAKLEIYLTSRIREMQAHGDCTERIIEQLGAVSDFGNYRRPRLRELIRRRINETSTIAPGDL